VRVLTVVGARPQFVKAAPLSRALRVAHEEILVHTGQHYDDNMSASFFRELELPEPDHNLGVSSGSHAAVTAEMLHRLEPVILEHEPDGVIVHGDTTSTLAGALAAAKVAYTGGRRPWLAHVEAGLRSFNRRMPEERNRVVADHLADLLLAPTEAAMRHLAREGLAGRATLVGDVMVDAHAWASARADEHVPPIVGGLDRFVLATLHRAENVDDPARLSRLIDGLALPLPVVFPAHPRTRAAIDREGVGLPANVVMVEPLSHLAMVALELRALLVATDSGGLQKEAYLAGVPCVTLRSETEWVETVEAGWNRVVDDDPAAVRAALDDPEFVRRDRPRPPLFGDGRAAQRVVAALELHHARVGQPRQRQEATTP
jgi:UDP-GlcNAc3NAcA epimerase